MPRRRKQSGLLTGLGLAAAVLLAGLSVWSGRHRALPPLRLPAVGPRVELAYRVDAQGAAGRQFQDALSSFVGALRKQGVHVARVLPDPGRATIEGEALDDAHVKAALAEDPGLPLIVESVTVDGPRLGRLVIRFDATRAESSKRSTLEATASGLRDAARKTGLAGDSPTVEIGGDDLVRLSLPWIDDVTEARVRQAIEHARLAAPIVLVSRTLLQGVAPPSGEL